MRNLRLGIRILLQNPGFAATAILALAVAVGASTAIFSFVDTLLLRPLPYPQADRLVAVSEQLFGGPADVSPANWMDWQARADLFETFAAWREGGAVLTEAGEPVVLTSQRVSHEFLPLLRVRPHRGRLFRPEDDRPGAPPVVILSHGLWQRRFGGEDDVVGHTIRLNETACRVIGVLPPGFHFVDRDIDYWEPISLDRSRDWRATAGRFINVVARIRAGASKQTAQAQITAVMSQLEREHPEFNRTNTARLVELREILAGKVEYSLLVLSAAVGALLLVGCLNVANLLLARTAKRQREIAVRTALGAGRWGIVRQLLSENLVLALTGGAMGVLVAYWAVSGLLALVPKSLVEVGEVSLDARVLLFALAISVLSSLFFGMAPAVAASRQSPAAAMHDGGRMGTARSGRLRLVFLAGQVALTLVLLCAAGLLMRTFQKLTAVDPGLDPQNLLTARVALPAARYQPPQRVRFFEEVLDRLRALPGVESASAAATAPLAGASAGTSVTIQGHPEPPSPRMARVRSVMPGYFRTLRTSVVAGREFGVEDLREGAPVSFVVNQAFVRSFLPATEPLGVPISVSMQQENPFGPIIGVVADTMEGSPDRPAEPAVFYSYGRLTYPGLTLLIRTSDTTGVAAALQSIVRELDRNQPVTDLRGMEQMLAETVARQKMTAVVLTALAGSALLLAAIGIYGVLSLLAAERTREIGVRMALGARQRQVQRLMVWQGIAPPLAGLTAGLALSAALSRLLRSQLFQVDPIDPLAFAGSVAILLAVALAAVWIPAVRASRIDPVGALRQE